MENPFKGAWSKVQAMAAEPLATENWFSYLKKGLSRELADDQIAGEKKYRSVRESLKPFVPIILRHWKMGAVAGGCLLASSLLSFPQPMLTRFLMDRVLIEKHLALLAPVISLMVVVALGLKFSGILQGFFITRFQQEVTLDIQKELLERTLSLPKAFFDKIQAGYLVSRIQNCADSVQWFFSSTGVQLLTQSIRFIGGLIFLFYLEWRIAVPVALSLPVTWFAARYTSRRTYVLSHHSMERNSAISGRFQEAFSSVSLIKAFSKERHTIRQLLDGLKSTFDIALEKQSVGFVNNAVISAIPGMARFFVLVFGSYWIIRGDWTVGSLLAFQAYLGYVYGPAQFLVNMNYQFQNSKASLERISALLDAMPEDNVGVGEKIEGPLGDITFKNVDFSYDGGPQVLKRVDFRIAAGQKVAVVGPSGAGKTTLISLMLRFFRPTAGEIYYGEKAASALEIRALRRRFGYVPQETALLSGSIMKNLRYGNEQASAPEVRRAAQMAEIHDFIIQLPNGYDTIIGERGARLSEGQKQRISIARALIRNPDVLIMDEPTSSLDSSTEAAVFKSLPKMVGQKTVIVISHREAPIQDTDQVIRLDGKGSVVLESL